MSKTYTDYLKEAGNVHLAYYLEAADILGIQYEVVNKSLMARFEKDKKHWFIINTATPLTNTTSTTIAKRKKLTNQVLEKAGIPVPKQKSLLSKEDAIQFFNEYNKIVVKPGQQLGGTGVTLLPQNTREVVKAYKLAYQKSKADDNSRVLGEEFIEGENYRFLVVGDSVAGIVRRKSAYIVGDGESNIKQLILKKNIERRSKYLKPIDIDDEIKLKLKTSNLDLHSRPGLGKEVILRYTCNLTAGGSTQECSAETHEYYKDLAISAVKAIGAKFGGVDLIIKDITKPSKCCINEINYNPGLRIHYETDEGERFKVAVPILEYIIKTL